MASDKEIRQRLGWAEDQLINFIETAGGTPLTAPPSDSALYHIRTAIGSLTERIEGSEPTPEPEPEPEPPPEPGDWDPDSATSVSPDGERTFDGYAGTNEFLSDTGSWRNGADDLGTGGLAIVERPFDGAGLTNAMQYTWRDQGCRSIPMGRGVSPGQGVTEVWMEVVYALSTTYTCCNPSCEPCAHKWIFWPVRDDSGGETAWQGRVELHHGGGGQGSQGVARPDNLRYRIGTSTHPNGDIKEVSDTTPTVSSLCDGAWHSLKSHVRITRGSAMGLMEVAVDTDGGWQDAIEINPYTEGSYIYSLQFGRNKDKGQDAGTEHIWISRIRWWLTDPGW